MGRYYFTGSVYAKIHLSIGWLSVIVAVCKVIPVEMKICAFVISTEGPQSGPKWRNLLKQIARLRFATLEMTPKIAFIIYNSIIGIF